MFKPVDVGKGKTNSFLFECCKLSLSRAHKWGRYNNYEPLALDAHMGGQYTYVACFEGFMDKTSFSLTKYLVSTIARN